MLDGPLIGLGCHRGTGFKRSDDDSHAGWVAAGRTPATRTGVLRPRGTQVSSQNLPPRVCVKRTLSICNLNRFRSKFLGTDQRRYGGTYRHCQEWISIPYLEQSVRKISIKSVPRASLQTHRNVYCSYPSAIPPAGLAPVAAAAPGVLP